MFFRGIKIASNGFNLLVCKLSSITAQLKSELVAAVKVPQWYNNKRHNVLIASFCSVMLVRLNFMSL